VKWLVSVQHWLQVAREEDDDPHKMREVYQKETDEKMKLLNTRVFDKQALCSVQHICQSQTM
jgi:hypothetical protein